MTLRQGECILYFLAALVSCTPDNDVVDAISPSVLAIIPDSGAINVSVNIRPAVVFSEPINPDSVISSTFVVVTTVGGHTGPIPGKVICNLDTLVFTPEARLWPGTRYTALIDNKIVDMSGNRIVSFYSWTFLTEYSPDKTAPQVISVDPPPGSAGISLVARLTVVFNEKIRPGTLNSNSFYVKMSGLSSAGKIQGKISCMDSIVIFEPLYKLEPKRSYEATITTGIMDIAGNPFAQSFSWTFFTVDN